MRKHRNAVVVVGLDTMQGLQTARIFADRGIPVYATVNDRSHHCARTNVCRRILEIPDDSDLIEELARLGSSLDERAVLVPCHDRLVLAVSAHREYLSEWYEIVLPDHAAIEMLMDKAALSEFARLRGLPTPATHVIKAGEDISEIAGTVRYPVVLKPSYRTPRWAAKTTIKGFKVESADELVATYAEYGPLADEMLVQEWIEGSPSELYSFNGYYDRDGKLLASFVARKLRQWPPDTGQSSLGEEVRDDTVFDLSTRLLESVEYRGLAYVEIKRDAATGEYFIVEPNVGRPTGRSAIAEGGGVELLYTMYCDALGLPLPNAREQRYTGVKWIHLRRDLQSAITTWRRDDMSLRRWWTSFRGPKVYAVFSWRDPKPFVFDLIEAARALNSPDRPAASSHASGHGASRRSLVVNASTGRIDARIVATELVLAIRGAVFRGSRHVCPCCGTHVRAFTRGGGSFRARPGGYCPRCNAKGRHRRVWYHLEVESDLLTDDVDLLHVAPKYCMYRALSRSDHVRYTSIDLHPGIEVTDVADLTALPFSDASFDTVLAIHVLEHVDSDIAAMNEMYRVLRPGGRAIVNVPLREGASTYEDPRIVEPEERRTAFGEPDHVRLYGDDLVDRLQSCGFDVTVHRADTIDPAVAALHGIPDDEHVFECRRPATESGS